MDFSCENTSINFFDRKKDAEVIFNDAANLNMTGAGYVWIVTEQALDASNAPDGLLGLKLINATQEKSHISDSLLVYTLNYYYIYQVSTALHIYLYLGIDVLGIDIFLSYLDIIHLE